MKTKLFPTDNFTIYDYLATTRETDFLPTILNWMCIPVPASWGIDGVNRIPVCSNETLSITDEKISTNDFVIYPNPANQEVSVKFKSDERNVNVEIIDAKGAVVSTQKNTVFERLL